MNSREALEQLRLLELAAGEYRRTVQEKPFSTQSMEAQSFEHSFRPRYATGDLWLNPSLFPEQERVLREVREIRSRGTASGAWSPRTARRESWPMAVGRTWVRPLLSVIFLLVPSCLLLELAILLSKTGVSRASSRSTYLYRAAELLTRWDEAVAGSRSFDES